MINIDKKCIQNISKTHFFISDDTENKPAFITDKLAQFEVKNNTKKNISFLQIDECVYRSKVISRCDCAIYSGDTFCFVELKTCKPKNKQKNRQTAQKQLKQTILNFQNHTILKSKKLEAYVSLTCKKEIKITPILHTPTQDKIFEFQDELNTRLYYRCIKEFNV